ncbi:hypothetical protein COOONC_12820, partial [Cooperia oncophora]
QLLCDIAASNATFDTIATSSESTITTGGGGLMMFSYGLSKEPSASRRAETVLTNRAPLPLPQPGAVPVAPAQSDAIPVAPAQSDVIPVAPAGASGAPVVSAPFVAPHVVPLEVAPDQHSPATSTEGPTLTPPTLEQLVTTTQNAPTLPIAEQNT